MVWLRSESRYRPSMGPRHRLWLAALYPAPRRSQRGTVYFTTDCWRLIPNICGKKSARIV